MINQNQYIEIKIDGHLTDHRASNFEGFQITLLPNGVSLISGEIKDQSELFGILIRIRDMGVPLLSVNYLPSKTIQTLGDA